MTTANISQFLGTPPITPIAGASIASSSLTMIGPDGLAYPAKVADYACASVGPLLPAFSTNQYPVIGANPGSLMTQGLDGTFYVAVANSAGASSTGLQILRYSVTGAFMGKVVVDSSGSAATGVTLLTLTNGNIAVIGNIAASNPRYAIYSPTLSAVVALTSVSGATNTGIPRAILLDGRNTTTAGFAVLATTSSTGVSLTCYNNAGVSQGSAAFTISSGLTTYNLAQLSNGNIVSAYYSSTSAISFNINTVAAAAVSGPTNAGLAGLNQALCLVSTLTGFFAIGAVVSASTAPTVSVWSNAGAQQGSTFTSTTAALGGLNLSLVNDGTNFWATIGAGSMVQVQLTTAGVATSIISSVTLVANYANGVQSVFDGCGNIVSVVLDSSDPSVSYTAFNVNLGAVAAPASTSIIGVSNMTGVISLSSLGDGVCGFYGNAGTSEIIGLGKVAGVTVVGVTLPSATGAVAKGSAVAVDVSAGGKVSNTLKGSVGLSFVGPFGGGVIGVGATYLHGPISERRNLGIIIQAAGTSLTIAYTPTANCVLSCTTTGLVYLTSNAYPFLAASGSLPTAQANIYAVAGQTITFVLGSSTTLIVTGVEEG